ncbi:hypothetical protein DUNSADRAFT_6070, partial [Dunaliella salina]
MDGAPSVRLPHCCKSWIENPHFHFLTAVNHGWSTLTGHSSLLYVLDIGLAQTSETSKSPPGTLRRVPLCFLHCSPLLVLPRWALQCCGMQSPCNLIPRNLIPCNSAGTGGDEPTSTCAVWRDPFFVPPVLDPKTGQPLPGQENRLQVPPAIAHTLPVASATPDEDGPKQQQQQQQLPPHAAGANGPQVLKDDDGYMMIIGSGHEGVGGTALVYRSKDLHRGWHFDGYLCTWPNLQTGLCWE